MREGSKNGNTQLTDAEVAEMRRLYKEKGVKQKDLAKRYGISQQSVSLITTLKRWNSHLNDAKNDYNTKQMNLCKSKDDYNAKELIDAWESPTSPKKIESTKHLVVSPWDCIKSLSTRI